MDNEFMKEKEIFPLLCAMALPMVISMLVNSLYNIIDSYFVAKISEEAMTAVSLVYPIQNLINAIAIGYGVGLNAIIARYLGAKDMQKADLATTQGFVFSVIHGILLTVLGIVVMPYFLRFFTNDEAIIHEGMQYSWIVMLFSLVIMMNLFYEKVFQAAGRMKVSMVGLGLGCITNIILDPLMIFGIGIFPKMGIAGAALATGIGQTATLILYLIVNVYRPAPVHVRNEDMAIDKNMALELYAIGIPASLNLALPSLLISVLNSILAGYSASYIVVLGIYYKLQTFLYLPANGIIQGMRPLIGYNYGAKEFHRVKKIYRMTMLMTGVIMVIGTCISILYASDLMGLFTRNPHTIVIGKEALTIISIGFIVSSISVTSMGALEGLGQGKESLVISLCRYVIVIIPVAFVLSKVLGAKGVWHAFWITEFISALIALVVYEKMSQKMMAREGYLEVQEEA